MTDEHNNILVATTNSSTSSSNNSNSDSSGIHHHLHHPHHQPHQHLNNSAIDKHVDAVRATVATTKPLPSPSPPTKDSIIAEATKILLKNGSTAAAAAAAATLLSAAATFQLPAPRPPSRLAPPTTEHHTLQHSPATYKQHNTQQQHHHHRNHTPPPAHSGGSSPGAVASGAIDVGARRHHPLPPRKFLNNGTSAAAPAAHTSAPPTKPTMAATTTTPGAAQMRLGMSSPAAAHLGGGGGAASGSSAGKAPAELGAGAIDYTFHAATAAAAASASVFGGGAGGTNNHHKYPLHGGGGSANCRSELGRHPTVSDGGSGPGGRLQFFKDGKFILELARSKDGDGKGGWVSVPRKLFRTPSAATSSTVTPTLATTTAYPKNESSTSLSFSDDNSSLQSSPWQRDHCWKQAAPRRGISHEMALYFWRPRGVISLTSKGLQVAHRKRRRPLDPPPNGEQRHFECRPRKAAAPEPTQKGVEEERPLSATTPNDDKNGVKEEAKETAAACSPQDGGEPTEKDNGPEAEAAAASHKMDISGDEELLATGEESAPKSAVTKDETTDKEQRQEDEKKGEEEDEPKKASEPKSEEADEKPPTTELGKPPKSDSQPTPKEDEIVEKMNTSEDDVNVSASGDGDDAAGATKTVNGHEPEGPKAEEAASSEIKTERPATPAPKEEPLPTGEVGVAHTNGTPPEDTGPKPVVGKPVKPRAKLNTIIQKLIDSMPAKVAAPPKVPSSSSAAAANNANAHHNNKVSPTTAASSTAAPGNASASRLVDYHQQHVSPRKRILRDLEKVSLEDSGSCGSAAGGKRSRAKGNSVSVPIPTTASSPRGHAMSSTVATSSAMANGGHASYQQPHYSNNKMLYQQPNAPEASPKAAKSSAATTTTTTTVAAASAAAGSATPTRRLYSSYSIHSLLGGGSGSSSASSTSGSSASPANSKRPGSDQAVVSSSSSNYAQQQPQPQQYTDPSYLRNMLASPKSPEASPHAAHGSGYGGKSPSSSASRRQRSPPYPPSPMHEGSSRSPAASHAEFGRRSPRATPPDAGPKQPQQLLNAATANSQMSLGPQHAAFYSQYIMSSPKYPPTGASSPASVARSPSHGPAPSSGYGAASLAGATQHPAHSHTPHQQHQHIPNAATTGGLYGAGKAAGGSLSPPRSMSASPRDSTPRTVPKKTASIRRQFASPTASSTTSSSCPSPSTEAQRGMAHGEEAQQHERKAAAAAASAAAHSVMQRSSPLGGGGVSPMLHPHYYMYPPNNAAAAAAAAHAAAGQAAAYIPSVMSSVGGLPQAPPGLHSSPSYYNPYISTIAALQRNPMWMQYPGGGVLPMMSPHPSAGSRLAAPFHGFPYNMAAAAAAAAFGGGAPPPPHGMMHPQHGAMSFYESAGPSERPRSPPKPTESTDLSMAATTKGSIGGGGAPSTSRSASQSTPTANNCIKDEQSSDVPLNLSKH